MPHVRSRAEAWSRAADRLIRKGIEIMSAISDLTLDHEPRRAGYPDMGIQDSVIARLALILCLALLVAAC
jgi:hypothetical protein